MYKIHIRTLSSVLCTQLYHVHSSHSLYKFLPRAISKTEFSLRTIIKCTKRSYFCYVMSTCTPRIGPSGPSIQVQPKTQSQIHSKKTPFSVNPKPHEFDICMQIRTYTTCIAAMATRKEESQERKTSENFKLHESKRQVAFTHSDQRNDDVTVHYSMYPNTFYTKAEYRKEEPTSS